MQVRFVREHVTVPLETLLGLFQNPLHLVQKRKDKLLDYDHLQYALDHADDTEKITQLREEVLLAKRNYEALNAQLLEELPCFTEAVTTMLQHQLTALVQAQYTFSSSVADILPPLLPPQSSQLTTSTEIEQQHAEELVAVCKDLAKLSLVPASFSYSRTAAVSGLIHKTSDSNSPQHTSTSSAGEGERDAERGPGERDGGDRYGGREEEGGRGGVGGTYGERGGEGEGARYGGRGDEGEYGARDGERGGEGYGGRDGERGGEREGEREGDGERYGERCGEHGGRGGERYGGRGGEGDDGGREGGGESDGEGKEELEEVWEEEDLGDIPSRGTKLQVLFEFFSEDPSELSVVAGQCVLLVCPHDRIGCKEWWLVQAQAKQGYVPATYLTEYGGEAVS